MRFQKRTEWRQKLVLPDIRPHNDPMIRRWHMIFCVPLAYETWAFPFRCALCSAGNSLLLFPDIFSDVCFFVDAIVHAFIAQEKPSKREPTRWSLFKHYMQKQTVTHFLPSALFYLLSRENVSNWVWWTCALPRFLPRFLRLVDYFRKMQLDLKVDMKKLQIVKFIGVLTLSCHTIGCMYYWLARMLSFRDNTWVGQFEETMPGVFDRNLSPWWEHYLALLYRGWIGMAPNSYRRPPQNWPEQLFSVGVMFLAMTLSAYLLGTVLPHIVKKDLQLEAYLARRKTFLKFATMRELPPTLVNKILTSYEFQFSKVRDTNSHLKLPRALSVKVSRAQTLPTHYVHPHRYSHPDFKSA